MSKQVSNQKVSKSFYLEIGVIDTIGKVAEEDGMSFSKAAERLIKLALEDYKAGRLKPE